MKKSPYPPVYFRLPAAVALARVHDGLIVTMTRIVGLCWQQNHRRTLAYTMAELVVVLRRPQGTLYRHFTELGQLGWIRVERNDKRFILHLLLPVSVRAGAQPEKREADNPPGPRLGEGSPDELRQALREAGIVGQPSYEMLHHKLSAVDVRAWHLWVLVEGQEWLKNPPGYLVTRLRAGVRPPEEFIRLAELTPEEMAQLRAARVNSEQHLDWPSLDDELRAIAPLWSSVYDRMDSEQRSSFTRAGSAACP